jgi:Protein of unknown function (DUF3052)
MSGYSGTPLAQKLGIRVGARLFVHGAPANYPVLLAPLPEGVRTVARIDLETDVIHLFATRQSDLTALLQRALNSMRPDAAVWVSWPKKAAGVPSDISEDAIRALALPTGLVDIKVCAVDETWSGLKLVLRRTERAASRTPRRRAASGKPSAGRRPRS